MKKTVSPAADESILKETAVTIGGAAGTVVALASAVTTRIRKGVGRIPAKNKTRLPRREKKAVTKATAKAAAQAKSPKRKAPQAKGSR